MWSRSIKSIWAQWTREIGIRLALGANQRTILRRVLRDGLGLAGGGIVLGLGAAMLMTKYRETLLYSVTPTDRAVFALVVVVLWLWRQRRATSLPAGPRRWTQ